MLLLYLRLSVDFLEILNLASSTRFESNNCEFCFKLKIFVFCCFKLCKSISP